MAEELNLGNLGSLLRLAGTVSRALEDGKVTGAEAVEILNAFTSSGLVKIKPELLAKVEAFAPAASEVIKAMEDGKFTTVEICDAGIAVLTAIKSVAGDQQPSTSAPATGGSPFGFPVTQ